MSEKKSNHQAKVVRIAEIKPHLNADTLELIIVGGYQVVSKKGQFKVGDLGVYIQPDSIVPQTEPFKFIWENYQCEPDGAVPEKRRRITVRKFRKEWSEADDFYGVDSEGEMADGCKWYEHEKYVRQLSKQFPKVLFTLEGEGEDAGDVWKKYFRNGKMQDCHAELVFPPFDPKRLR